MNIFRTPVFRAIGAAVALPLAALFLAACDVDSVDSTAGVVSDSSGNIYNYAGLYLHPNNSSSSNGILPIVYPYEGSSRPSGTLITSIRILQYGSVLEAFDSANQVWAGKISSQQGTTASFTLSGRTTAGQSVEIAGTMVSSGTSGVNTSTMDASWIEPSYFGTVSAKADIAPVVTNNPSPSPTNSSVNLSASSSSVSLNGTVNLTASGGNGSYTWSGGSTYGSLSSSGSTRTYTRTSGSSGDTETITVYDGNNDSDFVTLTFN